jgi:hypothetical protein
MKPWRIYRLPGSREVWHLDQGPHTPIINVRGFESLAHTRAVDIGGDNIPRAWIEINGDELLHVIDGIAVFGGDKDWICHTVASENS